MQIRKEQMDAFEDKERKAFEEEMIPHVRKVFPNEFRDMGEAQVRELVRAGFDKTTEYEIVTKRDRAGYIDLMFVLGRDFDTDKPWAQEILRETDLAPCDRLDQVRYKAGEEKLAEKRRPEIR